jgi:deoxyribonuclease-4
MSSAVDRIRAITGRIDLVHCNDSRDAFDSGADRHTNLGEGLIDPDDLAGVVKAAGAPVVIETRGGLEGQQADIAWVRARLG